MLLPHPRWFNFSFNCPNFPDNKPGRLTICARPGILAFLILLLLLPSYQGASQTHPVSSTVQLTPPYSIYLADYVASGSDQLKVHLLLRDLQQPYYDVRLHMRIKGTGIVIENTPSLNIAPLTLEGGVPLTLTASELLPYFDINNLTFSGISRSEFVKTGQLPEGFYRICFSVVDYRRPDVVLSNAGCANVWIVQNDPPRINLPLCGTEIMLTDPQSIIFQWTPMHTSSPNAANSTEYEFTLVEVRPEGRDPNDAINTTTPLYTETTEFSNLFYGPSNPVLIPGQRYAFRVRAKDYLGRDMFKNDGYSEVCAFTFGQGVSLEAPANIIGKAETERRAKVSWEDNPDYTGYELSYRKSDGNYEWFTMTTENVEALVNDLEPETSYEVQVTSLMNSYRSEPSDVITFMTPAMIEYACGEGVDVEEPIELKPLPSARKGNIFTVGEFEMRVQDIRGGDGVFSGTGTMLIPYLGMRIACKFDNISVNINQEVVGGEVVALTEGMEGFKDRWDDNDVGDDGQTEGENPGGEGAPPFGGEEIIIAGIIDNITVDLEDSTITITKADGSTEEHALQHSEDNGTGEKKFTDEKGNVYIMNQKGEVKKQEPGGSQAPATATPDSLRYTIAFNPDSESKYGFDGYESEKTAILSQYALSSVNAEPYYAPWKSVESGRTDYLLATETNNGLEAFPKNVGFKISGVSPTVYGLQDKTRKQIAVPGKIHGQSEELYSYIIRKDSSGNEYEEKIGAVNIVSYDKIRERVVLVPVNGASIPNASQIEQDLNKIYGAAVTEWEVSTEANFEIDEALLEGWDEKESGIFAAFPTPVRKFNREFEGSIKNIDKDAYYIFLIDGKYSHRAGFMPFKRKFGYVYLQNTQDVSKTIAHELGHGAFRLKHTFSEYSALAQGTTKNLMDYSTGKELYKYQWDKVHDPDNVVSWFVDDEEGEMIFKTHAKLMEISIENFDARFAPGFGSLNLQYSLSDTTMSLLSLYPNEEFKIQLLIFDKNENLIFLSKKAPEKSDTINFHGFNLKGNPISLENGLYRATINLIGGSDLDGISKVSSWSDFKNFVYEKFNEDSVNFMSIQQDTLFNIDKDALDFISNKEDYETFMEDRVKNNYLQFVDDFRSNGYFTNGKSPLKWMNDNGITSNSITFLGMNISRLTDVFKEVLLETEEILKSEYPEAYIHIYNQYSGEVTAQSNIRYIENTCMCNPSNHSLGCAIDIRVAYNPQITASNVEHINLIKHLTGLDLSKRKSAKEVTEAQEIFMKKLHGENYLSKKYTIEEILADYELINNFDSKSPFALTVFLNLYFEDVVIEGFQRFKKDVIRVLEAHKNRVVFEPATFEAIDILIEHLEKTENDTIKKKTIYNLENFREEKNSFITNVTGGEIMELSEFIIFFRDRKKRLYGNILLEDGFGDSPLELVESFNEAHKKVSKKYTGQEINSEWGGVYNNKYDGMHFGMATALIKKLTE